jgi:hypothetical protein
MKHAAGQDNYSCTCLKADHLAAWQNNKLAAWQDNYNYTCQCSKADKDLLKIIAIGKPRTEKWNQKYFFI